LLPLLEGRELLPTLSLGLTLLLPPMFGRELEDPDEERFPPIILPPLLLFLDWLLVFVLLLLLPPMLGRELEEPEVERLMVVVVVFVVVVDLLTTELALLREMLLPAEEREMVALLRLLVTVAALFFCVAVATLRLPAAAALEFDAGRRPCAIAPVDVMASPQASIKPIIVL